MVFYWNNDKRATLLRFVENVPSIWNPNDLAYNRTDINCYHFHRIGEIIGCSGDKVMKQFNALKRRYECYKENLNNRNVIINKNGIRKKLRFRFANSMKFLDQHLTNVQFTPQTLTSSTPNIIAQYSSQPMATQSCPLLNNNFDSTLRSSFSLTSPSSPSILLNNSSTDPFQFIVSPNLPTSNSQTNVQSPTINISEILIESVQKLNHLINILQAGTVFIPPSNPNLTNHQQHFINLMLWATANLSIENQKWLMHTTIQVYVDQSSR